MTSDLSRFSYPLQAAKFALRSLDEKILELDRHLNTLVKILALTLVGEVGVGTHNAVQLLITAWQRVKRSYENWSFLWSQLHLSEWCRLPQATRQLTPESPGAVHRVVPSRRRRQVASPCASALPIQRRSSHVASPSLHLMGT
jgi:hypothetical protein